MSARKAHPTKQIDRQVVKSPFVPVVVVCAAAAVTVVVSAAVDHLNPSVNQKSAGAVGDTVGGLIGAEIHPVLHLQDVGCDK